MTPLGCGHSCRVTLFSEGSRVQCKMVSWCHFCDTNFNFILFSGADVCGPRRMRLATVSLYFVKCESEVVDFRSKLMLNNIVVDDRRLKESSSEVWTLNRLKQVRTCRRKSPPRRKAWWVKPVFLSAANGQRPRNYLSCSCCSCSPFGSIPY